jgi:hypothetical protein
MPDQSQDFFYSGKFLQTSVRNFWRSLMKGKNKMKQPVHLKTTLRRALGRARCAVPGKLSGRRGVLAEEGALQRFFKKKGDVGP